MSTMRTSMSSSTRGRNGVRRRLGVLTGAVAVALSLAAGTVPTQTADAAGRTMSAPFTVASFNVLGASHTENPARGFDTYGPRMRRTVRLIERESFDIVGFQEYQSPQHKLFMKLTAGSWDAFPGLSLGRRPVQNSIVWRTAEWAPVEKHTYKIPYFYGKLVTQPYMKLRNKRTGLEVWVINTHNPADSKGPAQHWRDEAVSIQIDLANRLERTGAPVFLVGDFNDRDEAFCPITASTNLKASAPGGGWSNGHCTPPRYTRVDWVFLSRPVDVLNHVMLKNAETAAITDHPVVFAEVIAPMP
jgi:endonuclease/exonuclease/phosphatase family metal-dependent hydrolase